MVAGPPRGPEITIIPLDILPKSRSVLPAARSSSVRISVPEVGQILISRRIRTRTDGSVVSSLSASDSRARLNYWSLRLMPLASDPKRTGLLLSGGIDSSVLFATLVNEGWHVTPFYIRTGCTWEREEIKAAKDFIARVTPNPTDSFVELNMPLADLYGPHWSITGYHVPDSRSPDEAVFLPGRNPLLLMKPALWCQLSEIPQLAIATLAANPFKDATPEFFKQFEAMLQAAVGARVQIVRPFERLSKTQVLELGRELPLELTFSCIAPVDGQHCGRCNKCAERRRGFAELGLADRTRYHDSSFREINCD